MYVCIHLFVYLTRNRVPNPEIQISIPQALYE